MSESTIKDITEKVETASTNFEKSNTKTKIKYLQWNVEVFNLAASKVSVYKGTFGTGYPFYALNRNFEGELPIIQEQIRYNRQLVKDGIQVQKSIWECESCLKQKYSTMPDLKKICEPCPRIINELKPRKIINRLPDLDMWLVCEDGCVDKAAQELTALLEKNNMRSSDINPLLTIEELVRISQMIQRGERPTIFLPMDMHIIEYSVLEELIKQVPNVLSEAERNDNNPYLPIYSKSYRKKWEYAQAYNFIYDYLSAFSEFNFPQELQQTLDNTRARVANEYTPEELFKFLLNSATSANFRRFQSLELEEFFHNKVNEWKKLKINDEQTSNIPGQPIGKGDDRE